MQLYQRLRVMQVYNLYSHLIDDGTSILQRIVRVVMMIFRFDTAVSDGCLVRFSCTYQMHTVIHTAVSKQTAIDRERIHLIHTAVIQPSDPYSQSFASSYHTRINVRRDELIQLYHYFMIQLYQSFGHSSYVYQCAAG